MGVPTIFWYPAGSYTFKTIALPHVSAVNVSQFRDVVDAEGLTMTRLDRGGGRIVTIRGRYNFAAHAATIRALQTLNSHLRSGGRIAFVLDSDKAFMSRLVFPGFSGKSTINVDVNALPFGAVTLASGDELLIQQTSPLRYERCVISGTPTASTIGQNLPLSANLFYEHPRHTVVRTEYCFPSLYLDAAGSNSPSAWLSDVRHPGLVYDLDINLVELPNEIESMVDAVLADANRQLGDGGSTINEAVQSSVFVSDYRTYRPVSTDQFMGGFNRGGSYRGES
tara:strand:+ start:4604 stop:5446 length:843 start_codon:yes stop_codon:yes gene_type:complete